MVASSPSDANFFEILKSNYYVHVPFPIEQFVILQAVDAFLKFLKEPEAIKSYIDYSISPSHRRGEIGYRRRLASDHIYSDNKEFFHYHPGIFEKYNEFIYKNPTLQDFLLKAKPIWEMTYLTIQKILTLFESSFPGAYDSIFKTDCVHIILRFLKYDWEASEKYLAKPHFDAGSLSLAIAESCPGLRIGSCPENLKIVEHKPEQAIFMLSSNFNKVLKNTKISSEEQYNVLNTNEFLFDHNKEIDLSEFSAGWHDVIQMDETQIGKPFARWAVVAFIEAHGVEAKSRTDTHKWFDKNGAY